MLKAITFIFYDSPFSVNFIEEHIENLEMPSIYKIRELALRTFDLEDDLPGSIEIHQGKSTLGTSYRP